MFPPAERDSIIVILHNMTDKKCPRCGSRYFQIADCCTTEYLYEVENGKVIADGEDNDFQKRIKVTCYCRSCNHVWHPRNFTYEIDR